MSVDIKPADSSSDLVERLAPSIADSVRRFEAVSAQLRSGQQQVREIENQAREAFGAVAALCAAAGFDHSDVAGLPADHPIQKALNPTPPGESED